jgi:hypothetical protein
VRFAAIVGAALLAAGCSRTGFADLGEGSPSDVTSENPTDAGRALPPPPDAGPDARLPDAGPDARVTQPPGKPPKKPPVTVPDCTPTGEEKCNGIDDDCNGAIDEGLPSIPCAGGGEQYCAAGRYSACPTRCDECVPGSERVCFHSYCDYWAVQTCSADGKAFGPCREHDVPSVCDAVARAHKNSPELEQCCIDSGYCCRDDHDLDHDGNTGEMLGSCDEVSCTQ